MKVWNDTFTDTNTGTYTDTYTNTDANADTNTNTDGGRVIIGEVSLQKSFLYSGCMCWEDDLKNLNGPQQWGQPQKQKGLAHCWKAHSAGHTPLCSI